MIFSTIFIAHFLFVYFCFYLPTWTKIRTNRTIEQLTQLNRPNISIYVMCTFVILRIPFVCAFFSPMPAYVRLCAVLWTNYARITQCYRKTKLELERQ